MQRDVVVLIMVKAGVQSVASPWGIMQPTVRKSARMQAFSALIEPANGQLWRAEAETFPASSFTLSVRAHASGRTYHR
jgi:hypothetical protein